MIKSLKVHQANYTFGFVPKKNDLFLQLIWKFIRLLNHESINTNGDFP